MSTCENPIRPATLIALDRPVAPPAGETSAPLTGDHVLLDCLRAIESGNGTYRFCRLRHIALDGSCIDGDDIDLLGSSASVERLVEHLGQLVRAGRCNFRLHRSNPDKFRLTIYSRDLRHRIDFDLWISLWQVNRGEKCLRYADVAALLDKTPPAAGISRLPVDVEFCVYVHHLATKNKDLDAASPQARLEHYAAQVQDAELREIAESIRKNRRIDASNLAYTAEVLDRATGVLRPGQQLARRATRLLSRLTYRNAGRRAAPAMGFIGCDGSGKTSVGREVVAQSDGGASFLAGKELYRFSLPFRAAYKIRRNALHISAERLDEWLAPLAYSCAAITLRRKLKRRAGAGLLLVDRFLPDFLYVKRKTDAPRFSIWRRVLPKLDINAAIVQFIVPHDVLATRKQEMTAAGHEKYDADMMRHYTSQRFIDYTAFCNDGTLGEAVNAMQAYVAQRRPQTIAVAGTSQKARDGVSSVPASKPKSLWSRLATPVAAGWGVRSFLWILVGYMLVDGITPAPGTLTLAAVIATGLLCQMALYGLSHRRVMKTQRSLRVLRGVVAVGTAASIVLASGVGAIVYGLTIGPVIGIGVARVLVALVLSGWLLASSFDMRVKLLKMANRSRGWTKTAQRSTRVLLPIGPYHFNRLIDRIEAAASEHANIDALRGLAAECRVCCDSRFGRDVPWAAASRVVEAFCALRNRTAGRDDLVRFQRDETLDDVLVRPSLIASLVDAVIGDAARDRVRIRSSARGTSLCIQLKHGAAEPAPAAEASRELNLALARSVTLDRQVADDRQVWEIVVPPVPRDESFDWQEVLAHQSESVSSGCEGRFSKDAKRSFRRNGEVVRMQRQDVHDAKPTRTEDEFLILQRMMDAAPGFPQVTGCGATRGVSWLSYKYRDGEPLLQWLARPENRKQWFRLIADVDYHIRCLRENGVAHRDLNATNLIVDTAGRLAVIDFDQSVADDPAFHNADSDGDRFGLVTNDIGKLIQQCGVASLANRALARLDEIWSSHAPYELEFAGQLFAGQTPWYAEWRAIAEPLGGSLAGKRVLSLTTHAHLLPVFLASSGAAVTAVADGGSHGLIAHLADAAQVEVRTTTSEHLAEARIEAGTFDLVLAVGAEANRLSHDLLRSIASTQRQVVFEHAGSLNEARRFVESCGLVWRGIAGYSLRLCPMIAAAHPDHLNGAGWLKVKDV